MKTVKVSAKGQITLPAEALSAMKVRKGTDLVLVQQGETLVLVKASEVGKRLVEELGGFEALAAPAFAELWDNPEDEIWDEA